MSLLEHLCKKHIYIECRYRKPQNKTNLLFESCWKNMLWENEGIIPNLDDYADTLSSKISSILNQQDAQTNITITLTEKDFPFHTFFDTIKIPIYISINPSSPTCKYSGSYSSGESGWIGDKYYVAIDNLFLFGNPKLMPQSIKVNFSHEITHAYDDFKRRRILKKKYGYKQSGDDIFMYSKKTGQYIATEMADDTSTKFASEMGTLLYLTNNVEINAFIAQLKYELLPLMVSVSSYEGIHSALMQTHLYKEVENLQPFIERLNYYNKHQKEYPTECKQLLSLFNKTREKTPFDTLIGVKPIKPTKKNPSSLTISTKANTFNQMVKTINKKYSRLLQRLSTQGSKIAYNVYKEVGDLGTKNN